MKAATVGDYLLYRLSEMGIDHLFGVADDIPQPFSDRLMDYPAMQWVGCANGLNAAYAAEGYARCKPAAALMTTYGAGELSAVSGVAGSYAESIPLVHIVGAPGDAGYPAPQDGNVSQFQRLWQSVTVAQAALTVENAGEQIDQLLAEVLKQRRPGYLLLAPEVAAAPATLPASPLDITPFARRAACGVPPDAASAGQQPDAFWRAMQPFIQPGDLLVVENSSAAAGVATLRLPENCQLLMQQQWRATGFSLPAAFGAQTASPERRVILVTDSASAQRTAQELSSMMRDGQRPVIFLLNNHRHRGDRAMRGVSQRYNERTRWDWTQLPQALNLNCPAQSWRVAEEVQLTEVMKVIAQHPLMSLVEVAL